MLPWVEHNLEINLISTYCDPVQAVLGEYKRNSD